MLYNVCKNRPGPYLYPLWGRGMVLACLRVHFLFLLFFGKRYGNGMFLHILYNIYNIVFIIYYLLYCIYYILCVIYNIYYILYNIYSIFYIIYNI